MVCIQYIAIGVGLVAPVGPLNIELFHRGLHGGFKQAWLLGFGALAVQIFYIWVIYFGYSGVFLQLNIELVGYALGAFFLFYFGFSHLLQAFSIEAPKRTSPIIVGVAIAFFNPFLFANWYHHFGSTLNTLRVEFSLMMVWIILICMIIGAFLWYTNLAFVFHFMGTRVNQSFKKGLTLIVGLMLLWFCSVYIRRIAEITLNW